MELLKVAWWEGKWVDRTGEKLAEKERQLLELQKDEMWLVSWMDDKWELRTV